VGQKLLSHLNPQTLFRILDQISTDLNILELYGVGMDITIPPYFITYISSVSDRGQDPPPLQI